MRQDGFFTPFTGVTLAWIPCGSEITEYGKQREREMLAKWTVEGEKIGNRDVAVLEIDNAGFS